MRVEYTHHARRRMKDRHITTTEVELAINDPQITVPDGDTGKTVYRRNVEGRYIKVIAKVTAYALVITTAVQGEE